MTEKSLLEPSCSVITGEMNSQKALMKRYSGDQQTSSFMKDTVSDVDGCDRVDN